MTWALQLNDNANIFFRLHSQAETIIINRHKLVVDSTILTQRRCNWT